MKKEKRIRNIDAFAQGLLTFGLGAWIVGGYFTNPVIIGMLLCAVGAAIRFWVFGAVDKSKTRNAEPIA